MNNTLESQKIFPYIAWALVIGFALFTYSLTLKLKTNLSDIHSDVESLQQQLDELKATSTQ